MPPPSALRRPVELDPTAFVRVLGEITTVILGNPVSKGRGRAFTDAAGTIRVRTPKKTAAYESMVKTQLFADRMRSRTWPSGGWHSEHVRYAVQIVFVGSTRGDVDNRIKAILDAANGLLWPDDVRVELVLASKRQPGKGEAPGARVRILAVTASSKPSAELAKVPAKVVAAKREAQVARAIRQVSGAGKARKCPPRTPAVPPAPSKAPQARGMPRKPKAASAAQIPLEPTPEPPAITMAPEVPAATEPDPVPPIVEAVAPVELVEEPAEVAAEQPAEAASQEEPDEPAEPTQATPVDPNEGGDGRMWVGEGWTAKVQKNDDDEGWAVSMTRDGDNEPVLVSPWTMGRDKKNPKPLNPSDFKSLLKGARDVLTRHEQSLKAKLHRSQTVQSRGKTLRVDLDIVPDEDDPRAILSAWDGRLQIGEQTVEPSFALTQKSAQKWADDLTG